MRGKGTNLGDALSRLSGRLDKNSGGAYRQSIVCTAWSRIAGPSVVSHTTGAHLRDKELLVFVDSPVWATELSALAEPYRTALNKEIGEEAVKSVRFSVSRKVHDNFRLASEEREAEELASADKVPSVPLTEQEKAAVIESTRGIQDEGLRQTVVRATIADLEWKKGLTEAKSRQKPREGV